MRLIDADNLAPDICDAEIEYGTKPVHFSANAIDFAPTIDAVPVVRCRECIYFEDSQINEKGFLICPASGMEITDMDFCSYGERKEGADNG